MDLSKSGTEKDLMNLSANDIIIEQKSLMLLELVYIIQAINKCSYLGRVS